MTQLNLLPDVKLEYLKAQRMRRLVLTVSIAITLASIALLVLLLSVDGLQKKHLSDLSRNIAAESAKLQQEPQIDKILTVQNQLGSLTALHAAEPSASRLFDYLNQVTPSSASITDFTIDFTKQTATITGTADSLSNVNKYVDTLKFTKYTTDANTASTPAFSNIVLSSFSLGGVGTQDPSQTASYSITLSYDKNIFDIAQKITLTVPNLVTTRLQLDQPTDLFKAAPTTSTSKGGQ
jgi:Tfp pilus assembly protein PilN